MTRWVAFPILLALALLTPAGPALAQQAPPPVSPLNVFEDEGTFIYYRKGHKLGTTDFTWSKSGRFFNAIEFRAGDQSVLGTTSITVDENGLWTSIAQQTATGPVEVTREGEAVQVISGETTKDLVLPPGALVMEDLSPALMSQAVVDYDHEKGGKQEFPLFFIPLAKIRGSLEYLDSFERTIGEESQTFRRVPLPDAAGLPGRDRRRRVEPGLPRRVPTAGGRLRPRRLRRASHEGTARTGGARTGRGLIPTARNSL